jgi:hypothetical protein
MSQELASDSSKKEDIKPYAGGKQNEPESMWIPEKMATQSSQPFIIDYLERVSVIESMKPYKQVLREKMRQNSGMVVLDAGCGKVL